MALTPVLSKEFFVKIGTTSIIGTTDFDFEINKETIDVTTLDPDGWKAYLVDLKSWKVSCSGLHDRGTPSGTESNSDSILNSLITVDTPVTIIVNTTITADKYITGSAFITSFKESGKVGDKVTFSAEFTGTGALTIATN